MSPHGGRSSVNVMALSLGRGAKGRVQLHRREIIEGASGRALPFDAMVARLRRADVVLVGEQHDHREHHRLQGRIIAALAADGRPTIVGLEMLPRGERSADEALARYVRGEIDDGALAKRLRWRKRWGLAFSYYAPIFQAARAGKARIVGLNAPRKLVRRVARGGLAKLPAEQRARLPSRIDLGVRDHRRLFEAMMGGAHHGRARRAGKTAWLDRYYAAQCVWDATMAESAIAAIDKAHSKASDGGASARPRVVIIAGGGHVYYDLGIALRIRRRRPDLGVASVALVSVAHRSGREVSPAVSSFLVGTAPARPKKKR